MALYMPPLFAGRAAHDAHRLIRAYPFATLITTRAGLEPRVTHLPMLYEDGPGEHGTLLAHLARANPHWQDFAAGDTLAVFHGPHAYISPSWYVNPDREVPTWNYATVHAHGRPEPIEGAEEKLALIDRTTAAFEAGNAPPWTRKVEGARLAGMLDAVAAFRMPIARLEAKFKMNQNRTPDDRVQVIARLRETQHPDLAAMADWMQAHER